MRERQVNAYAGFGGEDKTMANIIDGKKIAAEMRDECIARVQRLKEAGVEPRLDVVIVGDDRHSIPRPCSPR